MKLRTVHVVLIGSGVALSAIFAVFSLSRGESAAGGASAAVGLGLAAYLVWFVRK